MEMARSPEVVREKISHLAGGRVSCALIFDRVFASHEISRFYGVRGDGRPLPADFEVRGRVIRYECNEAEEPRWRLAVEIFLVKSFRAAAGPRSADGDALRESSPRPRSP